MMNTQDVLSVAKRVVPKWAKPAMKAAFGQILGHVSPVIEDRFVTIEPSPQTALDVFKGEWWSKFPGELAKYRAGELLLFDDFRMRLLNDAFDVRGKRILELGPLEGGHSYMLEQMGAESVTAVEANSRAFLKCLIAKELLNLKRVSFLLGDLTAYLKDTSERFDIAVASGVLYHMVDPTELLFHIAKVSDRAIIWTHYYCANVIESPQAKDRFQAFGARATKRVDFEGSRYTLHKMEYGAGFENNGFPGGTRPFAYWMERQDILDCLSRLGFTHVQIHHEDKDAEKGPHFVLLASKSAFTHSKVLR